MQIALNGVQHTFEQIAIDEYSKRDKRETVYVKCNLFVNRDKLQALFITQYRYKKEPAFNSVYDTINAIPEAAFNKLAAALNDSSRPILVNISQVYGTTADYKCIYESYNEDITALEGYFDFMRDNIKTLKNGDKKYLFLAPKDLPNIQL